MANVRLLRQRFSDYNAAIQRANAQYQGDYATYEGKVEEWNAIARKTPYLLASTRVAGGGILGQPNRYVLTVSAPRASEQGKIGIPTLPGMDVTDPSIEPIIPVTGSGQYQLPDQYVVDKPPVAGEYLSWEKQVVPATYDRFGTVITPEQITWKPIFDKHPAGAGEVPEAPEIAAPREPSVTPQEMKMLSAPPTNAAGVEMARAKGYTGVSELVAENEDRSRITAFQSAFDNPDNPQALKDRGILAKTLAGKL